VYVRRGNIIVQKIIFVSAYILQPHKVFRASYEIHAYYTT